LLSALRRIERGSPYGGNGMVSVVGGGKMMLAQVARSPKMSPSGNRIIALEPGKRRLTQDITRHPCPKMCQRIPPL